MESKRYFLKKLIFPRIYFKLCDIQNFIKQQNYIYCLEIIAHRFKGKNMKIMISFLSFISLILFLYNLEIISTEFYDFSPRNSKLQIDETQEIIDIALSNNSVSLTNNSNLDNILLTIVGKEILSGELIQIPQGSSLTKGKTTRMELEKTFEWTGFKINGWKQNSMFFLGRTVGKYPAILDTDITQIHDYIISFQNTKNKEQLEILQKKGLTRAKNLSIEVENSKESDDILKVTISDSDTKKSAEFTLENPEL